MNWYLRNKKLKKAQKESTNSIINWIIKAELGVLVAVSPLLASKLHDKWTNSPPTTLTQVTQEAIGELKDNQQELGISNQVLDTIIQQLLNNQEVVLRNLEQDEGRRSWVYDDATGQRIKNEDKVRGNRTIGVGFNLEDTSNQRLLRDLKIDFDEIYKGEKSLTNEQIDFLLKSTSTRAWLDAATFIDRENFIQMPPEVQRVLQNMAFQLGLSKLQGFVQFKQALLNRDFSSAARAMLDSKWATQTPKRARRLAEEIASLD